MLGSNPQSDSPGRRVLRGARPAVNCRVERLGNHLRFAGHDLQVGGRPRCGLLAIVPLNGRRLPFSVSRLEASELWLPKSRGFGGSAP